MDGHHGFLEELKRTVRALRADGQARRTFWMAALIPSIPALLLAVVLPALGGDDAERFAPAARHLAFLEARLEHAKEARIDVALDLIDSTMSLEIGGVEVHRSPLRSLRVGASLRSRPDSADASRPAPASFRLLRESASIPKVPLRVVTAPRDSAEAERQALQPMPVETGPAHFALWFDGGLVVVATQVPQSRAEWLYRQLFVARVGLVRSVGKVAHLVRSGERSPEQWIHLELDPADARAIYRALPEDARLAVRF